MSKFDVVYRSLLLSNFFTKGWGKPEDIRNIFELRRKLANRETAKTYVERNHPVTITEDDVKSDHRRLKGYFRTPLADIMPSLVPPESEKAHFQLILPVKEPSQQGRLKPICSKTDFEKSRVWFHEFYTFSTICWNWRPWFLEETKVDGYSHAQRKR